MTDSKCFFNYYEHQICLQIVFEEAHTVKLAIRVDKFFFRANFNLCQVLPAPILYELKLVIDFQFGPTYKQRLYNI